MSSSLHIYIAVSIDAFIHMFKHMQMYKLCFQDYNMADIKIYD